MPSLGGLQEAGLGERRPSGRFQAWFSGLIDFFSIFSMLLFSVILPGPGEILPHLNRFPKKFLPPFKKIPAALSRTGTPVARLVPVAQRTARRLPGSARGKLDLAPDFSELNTFKN
jgi:hypothetical protein